MPEASGDQRHKARQGREGGGVAERFLRAALQVGRQLDQVQRLEARFAPGASRMFERLAAARRPCRAPAPGGLVADSAPAGHLGSGATLLEESGRLHPPPHQRGEVLFHTFGVTHIVLDNDGVNEFTILSKSQ